MFASTGGNEFRVTRNDIDNIRQLSVCQQLTIGDVYAIFCSFPVLPGHLFCLISRLKPGKAIIRYCGKITLQSCYQLT